MDQTSLRIDRRHFTDFLWLEDYQPVFYGENTFCRIFLDRRHIIYLLWIETHKKA